MQTLGDYRSAAMIAGVIIAVAVGVLIALRMRTKPPSSGPAAPRPSAGAPDGAYLDSSHVFSEPLLPRGGADAGTSGTDPAPETKPPDGPGEAPR